MEPCHSPTQRTAASPVDRVELFADAATGAAPLKPRPFASEADLRRFAERRLESALGLRLVAREVPVDGFAAGRIDVLAIDERHQPVVVEVKHTASGAAIGQALVHLDWVPAWRGAVAPLVARRLGVAQADQLDWSVPRLVCVAEEVEPRRRRSRVSWGTGSSSSAWSASGAASSSCNGPGGERAPHRSQASRIRLQVPNQ
jgi:hypothetical protein